MALTSDIRPANELVTHRTHKHSQHPASRMLVYLSYIQYHDMIRLMIAYERRRCSWVGKGGDTISRAQ